MVATGLLCLNIPGFRRVAENPRVERLPFLKLFLQFFALCMEIRSPRAKNGEAAAVEGWMVEHHHQRPNATTANCKELPKINQLRLASDLHMAG